MSDMLHSAMGSPRWQELQRSLAQSFGANANANAQVAPAGAGGNWLARVRRDPSPLHQLPHN